MRAVSAAYRPQAEEAACEPVSDNRRVVATKTKIHAPSWAVRTQTQARRRGGGGIFPRRDETPMLSSTRRTALLALRALLDVVQIEHVRVVHANAQQRRVD